MSAYQVKLTRGGSDLVVTVVAKDSTQAIKRAEYQANAHRSNVPQGYAALSCKRLGSAH